MTSRPATSPRQKLKFRNRWDSSFFESFIADLICAGAIEPVGSQGARRHLSSEGGSGYIDYVSFGKCGMLNCVNGSFGDEPPKEYLTDQPLVLVGAMLATNHTYATHGAHHTTIFDRPGIVLLWIPAGTASTLWRPQYSSEQSLTGVFLATSFAQLFDLDPEDLPTALREICAHGSAPPTTLARLPLNNMVCDLVSQVIHSPLEGALRCLQLKARVTELVALTLHEMQQIESAQSRAVGAPLPPVLRNQQGALAYAAQRALNNNFIHPPPPVQLARELNTHPNRLQQAFRQIHGMTMKQYCLNLRMLRAKQLLTDGRLQVAQVAYQLGYHHASSFSTAFQASTGMTPREFQYGATREASQQEHVDLKVDGEEPGNC